MEKIISREYENYYGFKALQNSFLYYKAYTKASLLSLESKNLELTKLTEPAKPVKLPALLLPRFL